MNLDDERQLERLRDRARDLDRDWERRGALLCCATRSFIARGTRMALECMDLHSTQADPKHHRQIQWGSETDICQWQSPHDLNPVFGTSANWILEKKWPG